VYFLHLSVPPNPSLHPTAYSGLRPLPSAGELKRYAAEDFSVRLMMNA
jgi:hypothetical protein